MKPITVWEKYNSKKEIWEHNHISDGHVDANAKKPLGTPEQNKIWADAVWRFSLKHIDDTQKVI